MCSGLCFALAHDAGREEAGLRRLKGEGKELKELERERVQCDATRSAPMPNDNDSTSCTPAHM